MAKRKRAAPKTALEKKLSTVVAHTSTMGECFDAIDGELANAVSPDSSELSSPPSDLEEVHVPVVVERKKRGRKVTGQSTVRKGNRKAEEEDDSEVKEVEEDVKPKPKRAVASANKKASKKAADDSDEPEELEDRPLPISSDYVPIPWKGRLGYACLNTYLRTANPPIFCSRTCRLDTILKHAEEGLKYVQSLGLANAHDLTKLIHWNEHYGIKFLRISSEMFPFASHKEHGYHLDFAVEALAEAGRAAMKYGHRLSMHPGQFTQLGSPRKEVVENAVRDIEYHCELLGLLGLKGQADKDAVMVLHMGGTFGDREATVGRFKENYTRLLSEDAKRRLVLENDDMCWSVHDLLPVCKELNIPLVLDWHHHNLIRDPSMREGTLDILQLVPEIKETWTRKGITQKQHYSEACDGAVKHRDRRKHSPRVMTLPPCDDTMDLMIEAKDKEQAVFNLMRIFKLDGWEKIGDVLPHVRDDENRPEPKRKVKAVKPKKKKAKRQEEDEDEKHAQDDPEKMLVPENQVGLGGPNRRVYWPEGMEHWLSPAKRLRPKKDAEETIELEADHAAKAAKSGKAALKAKAKRGKVTIKEGSGVETDQEIEAEKQEEEEEEQEEEEPGDDIKSPPKKRRTKSSHIKRWEEEELAAPAAERNQKTATKRCRAASKAEKTTPTPPLKEQDLDADLPMKAKTKTKAKPGRKPTKKAAAAAAIVEMETKQVAVAPVVAPVALTTVAGSRRSVRVAARRKVDYVGA